MTSKDQTAAIRNSMMRERRKSAGLVNYRRWVSPDEVPRIDRFIEEMRNENQDSDSD